MALPADHRLTRIVATIGPATISPARLRLMVAAGMDVARLNMSHGDASFHRRAARAVRAAGRSLGRIVGLMADLQGPKVRFGDFGQAVPIRRGMPLVLTVRPAAADPERGVLPVDYPHLPREAEPGHEILVGDGAVRLKVRRVRGERVYCTVIEGTEISPRTGFHLPQAKPHGPALTAKDRRDLTLAVELGVDAVALSFVRTGEDVALARRLLRRRGSEALIVAKIETPQALDNLDEILAAADGVMVARGDLGVALPPERVPVEQKRIIEAATASGKPVITATQMLESMRYATRPTRAEASDVANAVWDGSWALMLSAETATGHHPVEAVRMMKRIIEAAERRLFKLPRRRRAPGPVPVSEGIAEAATWIAFDVGARAIVALTRSGATARQVARFAPSLPVYGYTPNREALGRMTLYRGVVPRPLRMQRTFSAAIRAVNADLKRRGEARRGELVVILGGSPDEPLGVTNRLVVHQIR
ncbi:MAG: pyruvate kinase [Acidobacteria bacterium]|nr:MAG: pyruvate kinase [Acidobacteriota bacterium]